MSYDDLVAMSIAELRGIAADLDLDLGPKVKKSELIDMVWEAL